MKGRFTLIFLITCVLFFPAALFAQDIKVLGKVTDQVDGLPLPGVSITIEGTNKATSTDSNGKFTISAPIGAKLLIRLVGMSAKTITVIDNAILNISLTEDTKALAEVVVVGYGVQKKSVVTGAISGVKASDLENQPVTRIEQSLQGRTSGITIASSSGQPGSAATVRVRGISSFNKDGSGDNNQPLWVVDGVVIDNGGIGFINQSDIESIEVLKDAASQAIYGARAAAGVILVTTKKGKAGGIRVNYSGYYGLSGPAKKLKLLDATQYAIIQNETKTNAGKAAIYPDPQSLGKGTDWQDLIFNNSAKRQSQEFSLSGGNDVSTFYSSVGYLQQDGIVATDISKYKRTNIRLNSTHKLAKWLTLGQNLGYSHDKSLGLGNTNSEFGGPLSSAINLDPITQAVITDPAAAALSPYNRTDIIRDALGRPYGISQAVVQEMTNPLAYMQVRQGNNSWADNIVGNVYAELKPIAGLTLRSTLGTKLAYYGNENFSPMSYLNSSSINVQTSFNRKLNRSISWNLENTAAYTKAFDKHNFGVLVGQGLYSDNNNIGTDITYFGIPVTTFKEASLNFKVPNEKKVALGSEGNIHKVASVFARLNYNYDEKYIVEGVVRRDGSSRFGANYKFGVFPSVSAGWVVSKEDFFPKNDVINSLKFRGGYGVVGNDNIDDFQYVQLIGDGRDYTFGTDQVYNIGYSPQAAYASPNLKWEETRATNIGMDLTLFKDFTLTVEWYNKLTKDILQKPRIPSYLGSANNPAENIADMKNSGIEIELGYRKKIGEVNFSASGNFSYLKNVVTNLGSGIDFLSGGQSFKATTYPITRTAVGQAYNSFYGFKTAGIFQTQAEVDSYVGSKGKIQPNAKPGDFRWVDTDGDGVISENDRQFIGNPTPKYSFGITLNAAYKGFDISVFGQGVAGNKIFQGLRRLDINNANYQTSVLNRWTGPGTSNTYPRVVDGDPNKNFTNPSDFYLEKGDYFRIKVLQIGYNLPKTSISKMGLQRARVYVMSENLVTFTGYSGYDPEIGGGVLSIDRGIYPQARSFMLGLNIGF
ncbi:SusC/RagA family TonB-linked outer membrane protein [Pedobacter cryoconitis]|uniref:TonB-linked SusC/RagA family outer membrane protein n=1 Tax=Pedobacter cryoconitis TaxID=188932 RepID=A0A327T6M3_9SPHI|nr:TonB-dependent receptor [Pedobacter cryoconitis]RAJ35373.1 TonB-linked SusC/RagA family outer membrane protein [Pedobacter cryoconitis]